MSALCHKRTCPQRTVRNQCATFQLSDGRFPPGRAGTAGPSVRLAQDGAG